MEQLDAEKGREGKGGLITEDGRGETGLQLDRGVGSS